MSDTTQPRLATTVAVWGAPATSSLAFIAFAVALVLAWRAADTTLFTTLCGVAGGMATTATNFWLGSSHGSQKKDVTIAAQSQQLALSTPPPLLALPAPIAAPAASPAPAPATPATT